MKSTSSLALVSMLLVVWLDDIQPLRAHVLPHLLAFSIFLSLKHAVDRERPGCTVEEKLRSIDPSHCLGKTQYQSFPSGHTGISFALATALGLEMLVPEKPNFFGLQIPTEARIPIVVAGGVVASLTSLQRVDYCWRRLVGACLGALIGYVAWTLLTTVSKTTRMGIIKTAHLSENSNDDFFSFHDGVFLRTRISTSVQY